jgi:peroxiredoxin
MSTSRGITLSDFRNLNLLGLVRRSLRRKTLVSLRAGSAAPEMELKDLQGRRKLLSEALKNGPVLAVFFKVNCVTSQFTFPFLERLYERYGGTKFTLWGISQNHPEDTRQFVKRFGITFPILIDGRGYPASNSYGLTNSPTLFFIVPSGSIQISCIGFSKADLEAIAAEAARSSGRIPKPLFENADAVPAFKPG